MAGSGAAVIPGMLTPHCILLPRLWVQERQHTGPRGHWFHHTAGLGWKNEFVVGIKCIFCMSVTPKLLPLPSDAELRKSQRFQVFVPTLLHCKDWHLNAISWHHGSVPEMGTSVHLMGMQNGAATWKTVEWPGSPAIPLLGVYPKELKSGSWRDISTPVVTAPLFMKAKMEK